MAKRSYLQQGIMNLHPFCVLKITSDINSLSLDPLSPLACSAYDFNTYAKNVMKKITNTTKTAMSLKNKALFDLKLSNVSVNVFILNMILSFALSTLSSTLCTISECSFTMTANLLKMVPNSTILVSTADMASARSRR